MIDTSTEYVAIITYEMGDGVREVDEDLYDIEQANVDIARAVTLISALTAERDALKTKLDDEIALFGDALLIAHLSGASESKDAYVAGAAKDAAARIVELEKALGFYADPISWELCDFAIGDIGADQGKIAREALK